MERGGYLQRNTPLKAKKRIRVAGVSETADLKKEIQRLVREIVIKRDGGCFLRSVRHCNGVPGLAVLQADHLITRANSATFADTRLIVCVCKSCHAWKSLGSNNHKAEYDNLVWKLLPNDRALLWERCEEASWKPVRTGVNDWKLAVAALAQELKEYL